jgi:hypothetical protein
MFAASQLVSKKLLRPVNPFRNRQRAYKYIQSVALVTIMLSAYGIGTYFPLKISET